MFNPEKVKWRSIVATGVIFTFIGVVSVYFIISMQEEVMKNKIKN